jgi:hypothetical protein
MARYHSVAAPAAVISTVVVVDRVIPLDCDGPILTSEVLGIAKLATCTDGLFLSVNFHLAYHVHTPPHEHNKRHLRNGQTVNSCCL